APEPLGLGRGRRMGTEMLGLAEQLHRSFGVIPDRWKALSLQPRAASRWWEAHDGAMVPATLSGEEKWLAAAAFAEAVGDSRLAVLYTGFLVRQGWDRADIEAGTFGRLSRQRRGFGRALRGVKEMLIAGLDRSRVELAGADLSAEAVVELVDLARLTRSMVVVGALG
ncbi:MAG: hypothetical protein OEM97_06425, partial [Acidimicrobiia bacterium]|nr:hypothetical protein [Acidimicrobiia bacterium]